MPPFMRGPKCVLSPSRDLGVEMFVSRGFSRPSLVSSASIPLMSIESDITVNKTARHTDSTETERGAPTLDIRGRGIAGIVLVGPLLDVTFKRKAHPE